MTTPVTTLVEPPTVDEKQKAKVKTTNCGVEEEEEEQGNWEETTGDSQNCSSSSPSSCPTYTMGFLVPMSHQESPPSSAEKFIFIEYRPKMVVLARCVSVRVSGT